MIKKSITIFLGAMLIISCTTRFGEFSNNLTVDGKKWLYISSRTNIDSLNKYYFMSYYVFHKDGSCDTYNVSNDSSSMKPIATWSYNTLTKKLVLGKSKKFVFRIIRFEKDTIYFEDSNNEKGAFLNIHGKKINK